MLDPSEEQEKDKKKGELLSALEKLKNADHAYDWVYGAFNAALTNKELDKILDSAYIETAKRHYVNKHGVVHGVNTALFMLRLFELIRRQIVTSDYKTDFGYSPPSVLFTLLLASYIHDAGRFYDIQIKQHEERISDAIDLLRLEYYIDENERRLWPDICRRIRELCILHDRKKEPSEKVEIALLKLADALDCSSERAYTEYQHPEIGKEPSNKLKTILRKDSCPEKYYGCLSVVTDPKLDFNEKENSLEITLSIQDYAASIPIKTVLDVLTACESGSEAVQELSSRIRVYVEGTSAMEGILGKGSHLVYPEDIEALRGAKFLHFIYNIDIQDSTGNAIFWLISELKNESEKAEIKSRRFTLVGDNPAEEDKINIRTFTLLKDVLLEQFQSPEVLSLEHIKHKIDRELNVKHTSSEEENKEHTWLVLLPTLKLGDAIKWATICKWPKGIKLPKSEWVHSAKTPCEKLTINVFFPEDMPQNFAKLDFEIKSKAGDVIYRAPILHVLYDVAGGKRKCIHVTCQSLQVGYEYGVHWELDNAP